MRIGLVGYASPTGLGVENHRAFRCLPCDRWLVIEQADLGWQGADLCDWRVQRWDGRAEMVEAFLDGLDAVFCVERTVPDDLFVRARRRKVRCVLAVNAEWYDPARAWFQHADLLIARTRVAAALVRDNPAGVPVAYLPCPIDVSEFPYRRRGQVQRMVFSNGWGGVHDRKGWPEVRAVLERDPTAIAVRSQRPLDAPKGVTVLGPCATSAELYADADLAVQPSRFEGVGLAMLEAMACGVPVLTTDAPPMRDYVLAAYGEETGRTLLVEAKETLVRVWQRDVPSYVVRVDALRARLAYWRARDASWVSAAGRKYVEREHGPATWAKLAGLIEGAV